MKSNCEMIKYSPRGVWTFRGLQYCAEFSCSPLGPQLSAESRVTVFMLQSHSAKNCAQQIWCTNESFMPLILFTVLWVDRAFLQQTVGVVMAGRALVWSTPSRWLHFGERASHTSERHWYKNNRPWPWWGHQSTYWLAVGKPFFLWVDTFLLQAGVAERPLTVSQCCGTQDRSWVLFKGPGLGLVSVSAKCKWR